MLETTVIPSDKMNPATPTPLPPTALSVGAGGSEGQNGRKQPRAKRPPQNMIQTSIRMSRGTRETLNYIRHTLNLNKPEDAPTFTLGEVIELSIHRAYGPWKRIRDAVKSTPSLQVSSAREGRRRHDAEAPHQAVA